MKKVFYTAVLFLGLLATASAQEQTPSNNSKNNRLLVEVNEYLELSPTEKQNLEKLLVLKSQYLAGINSPEERQAFINGFEEKLKSTLDHTQIAKLSSNKALYKRLLSE